MKNKKIKSFCKINLSLRVLKKLNNGYHNIFSLITFCQLHDIIFITKNKDKKDKIIFSGDFKKGIDKKKNTIVKVLTLLRKKRLINKQTYKIKIIKNIPHGSGLGGGSANAAALLNFFKSKMKLKISSKKLDLLAKKIGFDVPISLEKKNTILVGKGIQMIRLKKRFNLNVLLVYPNFSLSTKNIYKNNKKISQKIIRTNINIKTHTDLINLLKKEQNDLQMTAIRIYPKIEKIINYIKLQNGCYFSRITGSGSACIGIFSNMKNAIYAKKMIKLNYPKYWCATSKTI